MIRDKKYYLKRGIHDLHCRLTHSEITYREIERQYHCSKSMITSVMEESSLSIPVLKPGPKRETPTNEEIDIIKDLHEKLPVGYQRCQCSAAARGHPISEWKTRKIFEIEGLFQYEKEYSPHNIHNQRFVANYAGQLWHTDLHYCTYQKDITQYIIGFIDDRTRYIIHAEIIFNKCSLTAANALENALSQHPKPYMMTIDNGTEFIGEHFQNVLKKYGILCHRTHPYSPEENGKIERWWRTIDPCLRKGTSLQEIIYEYNHNWPHRALYDLTKKKTTPYFAWVNWEHWENKKDMTILYSSNQE